MERDDFGLPYPFEASVYESRLRRLREDLRAEGLDGLLAFDQSSLFYLFGYDQIGYWVFQAVWIPADAAQPVRGLCRAADRALMSRGIGIDQVEAWLDDTAEPPPATLIRWARETGAAAVGLELDTHTLTPRYAYQLRDAAGADGLVLVPADHLVTRRRELKDAAELDYMRRAGRAVDDAFRAVGDAVGEGVLETELSRIVGDALLEAGCDPSAVAPCISAGRRTMFQTHLSAKPLPVPAADLVTVEIGAAFNRYHSVGYRTYFTPGASADYRAQYSGLRDAVLRGVEELAPGRRSTDIVAVVQRELERSSSGRPGRHVGYATGIGFAPTWLESLRLKQSQEYELAPGMTFFFFAGAPTTDGLRHFGYGLPVAITETGAEVLSDVLVQH